MLAISSIQLTTVFCLATLCENGLTLKVMVRSEDIFVPFIIPHLVSKANYTKVSKVQPQSWHVAMAKLHDFPTWPTIDRTGAILGVMVMHDEEGVVQLRGALAWWYRPLRMLLDFSAQPLMLGKVVVHGLGLIDADLNPCPYHILTSMVNWRCQGHMGCQSLQFLHWILSHMGCLTHSQVPGWTHLRVHQSVVVESWDSEGAPGFQL